MFGAEILPEIARFDAFDTARQHTMFDGCPQKTSIPLKSQKHILAYHNFKCQWIGLNIFMTIKGSKIYLILKSGADGNSIIFAFTKILLSKDTEGHDCTLYLVSAMCNKQLLRMITSKIFLLLIYFISKNVNYLAFLRQLTV